MNVLIVDDSNIDRIILKDMLQSEGHIVKEAENGHEALQMAAASTPDIIISDILMPVMDGFKLCKEIRGKKSTRDIIFIFYTATYTETKDEELALKIGADGYIRKSQNYKEFSNSIQKIITENNKFGRGSSRAEPEKEEPLYKLYNERLIKKLEDKVLELEKEIAERKRLENELSESRNSLKLAIDGANIGMWDWDIKTGEARFTDRWAENFGYEQGELPSHFNTWENLIHPEDKEKTLADLELNLNGKTEFYENEHRLKEKSGEWRWVLARGKVVKRSSSGTPLRHAGTFLDITERVNTLNALDVSRQQMRRLSGYLQSAGEFERKKIAREIHDDLGQSLTAIKLNIAWMIEKIPKSNSPIYDQAKKTLELIDNSIISVKRISAELRPSLLDDLGLAAAVEWYAKDFQKRTGISLKLEIHPNDIFLSDEVSITVFRIFQEALTNIIRHSHATGVSIRLFLKDEYIELIIKDNGLGITEGRVSPPGSFGILGMKERAGACGGEINIYGIPQKGTTVEVRIPV